jgi:N-acetylglutamate synthase-like GNAT family acetyltransferase
LFPFGFIDFFKELKTSKVLDMMVVAVHPDYKKTGVLSLIFVKSIQHAIDQGIAFAETGPELSYNQEVQSLWKHFQTRHHKTRSAFLKKITL